LADTKNEIERHRASAQHEVDDLSRQKESISSHLAQISQLLGTQMPGLADALKPQQSRHAVGAPAPKAVAPPAQAPAPAREERQPVPAQAQAQPQQAPAPTGGQAPAGAQKQPVSAKAAKGNDDEWWTE
jgi:hypothetical protein